MIPDRRWLLIALLISAVASVLGATDLRVDRARIHSDESVQVVLTLTDALASLDAPQLPLKNLVLDGTPSVSSQFQWINGVVSRERTYTYSVHPTAAGTATVGPLILYGEQGQVVLPQVTVVVLPEAAINPNAPSDALNELKATGGEQVLLSAEVSSNNVYEGEEVLVTWYLYSAETVRGFNVTTNPVLSDFWSEEIPIEDRHAAEIISNGVPVLKIPIRRVALFPLHAGELSIPPMELVAQMLKPIDDVFGMGGIFEGRVVEIRRKSQALPLSVRPLPVEVDGVGDFAIRCTKPASAVTGPVKVEVTVSGRGNLRAVKAPDWELPIAGAVESEDLATKVDRTGDEVRMTRSWRFVIFPSHEGTFTIPPLRFRTFDPRSGIARTLRCEGGVVDVKGLPGAGASQSHAPPPSPRASRATARRWLFPTVLATLGTLFLVPLYRSRRRPPVEDAELASLIALVHDPRELRRALYTLLTEKGLRSNDLFHDPAELGERFRYLHSWIDLLDKEPDAAGKKPEKELRRRAAEFLAELKRVLRRTK